ncbi:putative gelsolin repeat protein [Aspergillus foveolatus]|uniref:putative gelsolin repeat protein n=1 Tax=Aspergillus foveolatus TaxID=210207 RepID=UPI003CCE4405
MTSTPDAAEGSEDVNDFLQRIRELGEKRDKEDEERTKKLEEEILQGRKERQARRAERARSISPTKDSSPILDPARLSMSSLSHRAIDPPEQLEPTTPRTPVHDAHSVSNSFRDEKVASTGNSPAGSRLEASEVGVSPKASPTLRSRAGTLSWQQRPSSRDLSGNRTFFSTSPSRETRWRAMSNASTTETGALVSPLVPSSPLREPSFLRQPEIDDTLAQETPFKEGKVDQSENTKAPETMEQTESAKENGHRDTIDEQSPPPSRASSSFADSSLGNRYSVSSVSTATGLGSPLPLSSAKKFELPKQEGESDSHIASPASPRRLSPERSTSPTKGLGGFVQSAMLRRSDSVSKRWSAQLPSGLSRNSSFASNRNSFAAPSNTDLTATPRLNREGTSISSPRPSSSHSEATIVRQAKAEQRPATPPASSRSESLSRPPLTVHARSSSIMSVESQGESGSRPTTPVSRTMDQRRWSPTKSTWLESALNISESPRHKRQPSQQSISALNKDRQSRTSVDLGRRNSFKEVNTVGLMRTTPLGGHVKKQSLSGIPNVLKTPDLSPTKEKSLNDASLIKEEPPLEKGLLPIETTAPDSPSKTDGVETAFEMPEAPEAPNEVSEVPEVAKDSAVPEAADKSPEDDLKRKNIPPALSPTPKVNTDVPVLSPRQPIRDPILNRPKPQSPVVDFRANLRKREVVKDPSSTAEPEFKNVFGKLRKAETSNYVAPDELKNNILKGKAALNMTGGPKKTQRVDELKESILKQKEAMKANGTSVRRNTLEQAEAPTEAVPEAILKRRHLAKSSIDRTNSPVGSLSPTAGEGEAPVSPQLRQPSPVLSKDEESAMTAQPAQSAVDELRSPSNDLPEKNTAPITSDTDLKDEAERHDTKELVEVNSETGQKQPTVEAIEPVRPLPPANTTRIALPVKEDVITKGSLAGRINPALAGLLSRGPPAVSDGSIKSKALPAARESALPSDTAISGPALTHLTKARAKGPKRRPPKAISLADENPDPTDFSVSAKTTPSFSDLDTPATNFSPNEKPLPDTGSWPLPEQGLNGSKAAPGADSSESSPPVPSVPEEPRDVLPPVPEKDKYADPLLSTPSRRSPTLERKVYEAESQGKSPSISAFTPSQPVSSPSSPQNNQPRTSFTHYSSPTPSPLRTSFMENQPVPSPRMGSPYNFLNRSRDSSPFRKSLPSPPVPPKGTYASTDQLSSPRSSVSLVPQADESLEAISHFFKTLPRSSDRVNIDPQLMLTDKGDGLGIRTLKKQIWEITGEGNKQDLPVNQEYILYEGAMYLCVHSFEEDGSPRTEVQLWRGDDIWGGAVDSALPFARKVARENSCKLEIISQGKEPARFIQALGGILITRRGSSSRSSSSAIFMLCGRKHLGQMVFDEVDFSPRNLCSGYPFVISAMFGKVYLWKGKGSSAEEIGAARLIGMDLGLTGEFEEVAEGEEPSSFYEVFPQHKETEEYAQSEDWLLKPAHDHFRHRLLRVDHELGQRSFWIRRPGSSSPVIRPNDTVQEVEPFSQKDLSPRGIYILDTFFEIYVIVGEQASNRPAEFASAVVFAHEYGILAASLQDRPFIPKSFISLGGTPETCRSAFRKWTRRPLERPPQVFPLNAAIDAIRS